VVADALGVLGRGLRRTYEGLPQGSARPSGGLSTPAEAGRSGQGLTRNMAVACSGLYAKPE